jgi:hypothetical protein
MSWKSIVRLQFSSALHNQGAFIFTQKFRIHTCREQSATAVNLNYRWKSDCRVVTVVAVYVPVRQKSKIVTIGTFSRFLDFLGLASHFGDFPEVTRQNHDFLEKSKNLVGPNLGLMSKKFMTFLQKSINLRREECASNDTQSEKIYFWTFKKSSFY